MKRVLVFAILMVFAVPLSACSKQELADMTTSVGDGYAAIGWEDRTYMPYCAIGKDKCGKQIGIMDGDEKHMVFEYEGYPTDEWLIGLIDSHVMDSAMLYREISVTEIPDGLWSEYSWNS